MTAIFWLIDTVLTIAIWIIIIQVVMSWLINFNVINVRQPFVYQVWQGLDRLTRPIYQPIRRMLPDLGGIDLAPLIVLLGIYFIRVLILADIAPMLGAR